MKTVWTINIDDQNYFPPNHSLKPVIWENKLFYAFKTVDKIAIDESGLYGTKICVLEIDLENNEIEHKEYSLSYNRQKAILSHSKNWKFIATENVLKLDIGLVLIISTNEIQITNEQTKLEEFNTLKLKYEVQQKNW